MPLIGGGHYIVGGGKIDKKLEESCSGAAQSGEHPPGHQKVVGGLPCQGTHLGCRFSPGQGAYGGATNPFLSHIDIPLSFKNEANKGRFFFFLKKEEVETCWRRVTSLVILFGLFQICSTSADTSAITEGPRKLEIK